jgi:hypothetical protein
MPLLAELGDVAGSVYFVPNPALLHGYAMMLGVASRPRASSVPFGENATPPTRPVGSVAALVNFVPNPALLHGYALTHGLRKCPTASAVPSGENAIE